MSERFFVSPPVTGDRVQLTGDEARHLTAVMRARVGEQIVLFDGGGAEFVAEVTTIRKQAADLTIVERRAITRELTREVTLAVALPKGERQKWLVEKATELGVTRLVPLITTRGIAEPVAAALERLKRTVIEACKQCGRNRLMEIAPPVRAGEPFASAPAGICVLADPNGQPLTKIHLESGVAVTVAVGPEGGFTGEELSAARDAGWQFVSLGRSILRVETAAIAMAAWAATQ